MMSNMLKPISLALCIVAARECVEGSRLADPKFGARALNKFHSKRAHDLNKVHVQNEKCLYAKLDSLLESSIFVYRGGEVLDDDDESAANDVVNPNTENPQDSNEEAVKELPPDQANSSIHVQATVSSQHQPEEVKVAKKKSNAVGDPDGNSSDDEDSDEEDLLEELAEIERQNQLDIQNKQSEGDEEFDKLTSLAERRGGMKRRIEEMELEMERRRGELELDDENDLEITVELVDEEEPSIDSSYHLAKEKITQDSVMKRQRKYKRGFMTKKRNETETKVKTTIDAETMDNILVEAFRPMLFLPPPVPRLPSATGSVSLKSIDIASRRRLDRRTLYHGLLAELGGSHPTDDKKSQSIRRRYLEGETARELRGALSLACQPKWRERIMVGPSISSNESKDNVTNMADDDEEDDGYDETVMRQFMGQCGVCLFPPLDEEEAEKKREFSQPKQQQFGPMGMEGQGSFFGEFNNEEGYTPQSSPPKPWRCTMSMQETLAMALAHSLSCGLALIDDEALSLVRDRVEKLLAETARNQEDVSPPTIDPEELRNAALIRHMIRLANEGKISLCGKNKADSTKSVFGRLSNRMERDLELDLDDCNDDLAVESLRLMKEDEQYWFESNEAGSDSENKKPLPLVLFLRSDSSPAILRSNTAVETLAHECVKKDGIHLLVLGGKGIDASTTSLPDEITVGTANGRMHNHQPGQGKAFSMMSNFPPGSPEFNAQMENSQTAGQFTPGAFNVNNINASGVNDPEGSRRFNIFLARTVDQTGKPQIMGTIAPPQAGNLFPTILANMAKENLRKIKEQGIDEDNQQQAFFMKQMEDLVNQVEQMGEEVDGSPDSAKTAFFNATISSPFGSEVMNQNNDGENGNPNPPPEFVRRAIQDAMTGVIDRLAQMSSSTNNGSGIPVNIAQAFSKVLLNENLRRGIAENLSRAAPALIDPRCQGVMLSVYVPPGPNHPNKGMMPGDQFKGSGQKHQQPQETADKHSVPHGVVGSWLNKILSSATDKTKDTEDEQQTPAAQEKQDEPIEPTSETTSPNENSGGEQEKTSDQSRQDSTKQTKPKGSKRKRSMDRARTLAVAAAALAGSKKEKVKAKQAPAKLTPQQRSHRNLVRLQALCRSVPLPNPNDPVRARSWEAWADREEGSVVFRKNRDVLLSRLEQRKLSIETHGSRGAGTVLRQMLSVRDVASEMDRIIKCAVELEAAKSQRHDESPWGVPKPYTGENVKRTVDKTLVAFLQKHQLVEDTDAPGTRFIHPTSLELALSNICGVSPSGGHGASSSSSAMASHRSKEDLMALAQDKHERALIPNCVSPQDIGVTYDMIGGLNEVKELLRQSITYPLKFPHLYNEGIAREAVKGVLLFGPPGTGKTMLAKAVATEGGASFLSVDASSVENKWLGESEKNAKAVFTLARRLAPCVIFIDEVDSLLSSREGSSDDSAHGTLTSVKTTMMSEWDGLNSGTNGKGDAGSDRVVVIGSTNRPFDLDEAVLRRFPRRILVDLPDLDTRREILEVTLSENRLGPDVNLTKIAERLEGYTGSDLKEVCREAVVQISHEQARMLDRGELLDEDEEDQEGAASFEHGGFQMLRPVTMSDFESAMRKLKRSVSETGRELARVWEWNDQYGELKKTNKRDSLPQMMNMFV